MEGHVAKFPGGSLWSLSSGGEGRVSRWGSGLVGRARAEGSWTGSCGWAGGGVLL